MSEQARLRAAYLRFLNGGPWAPLAAVPSCAAPHIRCDRADHAVDVNAIDGGAWRLFVWLRAQGAQPAFTVPGEPWHIEIPKEQLLRLAGKFSHPLWFCTPTERRVMRELSRLRRHPTEKNRAERKRLVRWLVKRRKAIYADGRRHGFGQHFRRQRYNLIARRTYHEGRV